MNNIEHLISQSTVTGVALNMLDNVSPSIMGEVRACVAQQIRVFRQEDKVRGNDLFYGISKLTGYFSNNGDIEGKEVAWQFIFPEPLPFPMTNSLRYYGEFFGIEIRGEEYIFHRANCGYLGSLPTAKVKGHALKETE